MGREVIVVGPIFEEQIKKITRIRPTVWCWADGHLILVTPKLAKAEVKAVAGTNQ